ncbi:MAG: hypothetical protein KGY51_11515 [Psychroflexus sp.]|nr:hypothetical protein [Psychroflexus sp.]
MDVIKFYDSLNSEEKNILRKHVNKYDSTIQEFLDFCVNKGFNSIERDSLKNLIIYFNNRHIQEHKFTSSKFMEKYYVSDIDIKDMETFKSGHRTRRNYFKSINNDESVFNDIYSFSKQSSLALKNLIKEFKSYKNEI